MLTFCLIFLLNFVVANSEQTFCPKFNEDGSIIFGFPAKFREFDDKPKFDIFFDHDIKMVCVKKL
jgi:hypothetical protein